MPPKNSQILLIENVLSSINEELYEKDATIKHYEEEIEKFKSTITTLKHECKSAFNEQEKLEETIIGLKKQNLSLSEEVKTKEQEIGIKNSEINSMKIQSEQFMDNIEKRIDDLRGQLDNKNSIIIELENINKELVKQVDNTNKDKKVSISKLERQLEKEEFKNFINTDNNFDFSSSKDEKIEKHKQTTHKIDPELQLDKLESKLKDLKNEIESQPKKSISGSTEEEILKKNLGF